MFIGKIEPIIKNGVVKIGGKYLHQKGIGTVFGYLTGDEGQFHSKNLKNVLYFPDSPVNIITETELADSMENN